MAFRMPHEDRVGEPLVGQARETWRVPTIRAKTPIAFMRAAGGSSGASRAATSSMIAS